MSGRVDSMVWIPRRDMVKYQVSADDLRLKYKEGYGMSETTKVLKLYVPDGGEIGIPRAYFARNNKGFADLDDERTYGDKVDLPFLSTLRPHQVDLVEDFLESMQNSADLGGILCAGCGFGKCVKEDTLVFTDLGMVEAGELVPPESGFHSSVIEVNTVDGSEETDAVYQGGESDTIKVTTRFGYEIEGTPEHPVLIFDCGYVWRKLEDLSEGDHIVMKRGAGVWGSIPAPNWVNAGNAKPVLDQTLDNLTAEAVGLLVAEGHATEAVKGEVRFSNAEEESVAVVRTWMRRAGFDLRKVSGDNVDYTCASVNLRGYLLALGLSYARSDNKEIPKHIRMGGREILASFLRGYIEGDGHVAKNYIEVASASKRLLQQTQAALLGFGMFSSLSRKRVNNKFYYRLFIFDLPRFRSEIGFITQRKSRALNDAVDGSSARKRNPNVLVVPTLRPILHDMRRLAVGSRADIRSAFRNYTYLKHSPSRDKLRRMRSLVPEDVKSGSVAVVDEVLRRSDTEFLPVTGITRSRAKVVDLSVPGSRSFVGNGVVCHNTVCGLYLAHRIGRKTLVVVHTSRLFNQWIERCEEHMGVTPGTIREGIFDTDAPIVIAMLQTLRSRQYDLGAFDDFGLLVVDETHRLAAPHWVSIIESFACAYRIGLTATPRRKDKLDNAFFYNIGRILARSRHQQMKPLIYFLDTKVGMRVPMLGNGKVNRARALNILAENDDRNRQIARQIIRAHEKDRRIMVLSDRMVNLYHVRRIIKEAGIPDEDVGWVVGAHWTGMDPDDPPIQPEQETTPAKPSRTILSALKKVIKAVDSEHEIIVHNPTTVEVTNYDEFPVEKIRNVKGILAKRVEAGSLVLHTKKAGGAPKTKRIPEDDLQEAQKRPIILATYGLAAEGLDVPELDVLVLATPRGDVEQPVGRALRILPDKKQPIVVDFVDSPQYFRRMKASRKRQYRNLGYELARD